MGWQVPINYPLVGRDAFRTATGVHAAAIIKAEAKGNAWLADRIYSGVPAGMFGRKQEICVGYMSGASNVNYWLRQRKIEPSKELVDAILAKAKATDHILTDEEILSVIDQIHAALSGTVAVRSSVVARVGETRAHATVTEANRPHPAVGEVARRRVGEPARPRHEAPVALGRPRELLRVACLAIDERAGTRRAGCRPCAR